MSDDAPAPQTPAYGSEQVLPEAAPDAPADIPRARRSPWNRPRDRAIAAAIAVVVVAVSLVVALTSDSAATDRAQAPQPPDLPPAPAAVPGSLSPVWTAPSAATPIPISTGGSVVTADGSEVAGRDPLTGRVRWHYTRTNLQLCTANETWGRVNVAYHRSLGCSEVTQLDPGTGQITAQRNGDAELGTQLVSDGNHVTTTGKHLLDTWRDDLVKTEEYGKVPALVNSGKQPRAGCTYGTVAASNSKVGVIERCPGDPADRLTVYKAVGEHEDQPEVTYSSVLAGKRARLIAMSGDQAAVVLPDRKLLVLYNADGTQRAAYPLDLPPADLAQDPPAGVEQTTYTGDAIYWFTGSKTLALGSDLTPHWTLSDAMGPGITFDHQLVIPIRGGLAVLDPATGATLRTVGVNRNGYQGPVRLAAAGPVLLEQRGSTLVALK